MSLEVYGDEPFDEPITDERVEEAFQYGAQACREMLARFVEQGGDATTAASIRANWHPAWGTDPGPITGGIPIDAWGMTEEMMARSRERVRKALANARAASAIEARRAETGTGSVHESAVAEGQTPNPSPLSLKAGQ